MTLSVALVLDQHFGSSLEALAEQMPVWIISSRENDVAVDRARDFVLDKGRITSLLSMPRESEVATLWRALCDIEAYHGAKANFSPYDQVVIYGSAPELVSAQLMAELGFALVDDLPDMYCLRKRRTAK